MDTETSVYSKYNQMAARREPSAMCIHGKQKQPKDPQPRPTPTSQRRRRQARRRREGERHRCQGTPDAEREKGIGARGTPAGGEGGQREERHRFQGHARREGRREAERKPEEAGGGEEVPQQQQGQRRAAGKRKQSGRSLPKRTHCSHLQGWLGFLLKMGILIRRLVSNT